MQEVQPPPERRSLARYSVDTEASLVIVNDSAALRARMLELSLDGCRVRGDRQVAIAANTGVEITFKINGIAFRLAGTMQWLDTNQIAGIQFSPMAPRRREALEDLLGELEAQKEAEQQVQDQTRAQAEKLGKGAQVPAPASGPGPTPLKRKLPIPISSAHSFAGPPVRKPADYGKPPARSIGRERREQSRHIVDTGAIVYFIDVRAQIPGRIIDLSTGGCRIRTDDRFPVGIYRRVETEFKVDGLPFRLAGVIQALHDKFTVGIRFLDLSHRKQDQLAQLMQEIDEMKQREAQGNSAPPDSSES